MITFVTTATKTVTEKTAQAVRRHRARSRYWDLGFALGGARKRLYSVEDPAARAVVLEEAADLQERLAALHTTAYGPDRPPGEDRVMPLSMPESLQHQAELYRLAAAAEFALAMAGWTPAEELRPGDPIWFAHEFAQVTEATETRPEVITVSMVFADGGTVTADWDAGDTIRTNGLPDLEIDELTEGLDDDERRLWRDLAVTRDRDHRAELLARLADAAADRVGGHAAQVLYDLADAELEVIAPAARPSRWSLLTLRATLSVLFFQVGAVVAVPAVLPIGDTEALVLLAGFAAADIIVATGLATLGPRTRVVFAGRPQVTESRHASPPIPPV